MRKIAISALGVLVSVLASPTAVGQEKPKVQVPKPRVGVSEKAPGTDESRLARQRLKDFRIEIERQAQASRVNRARQQLQLRRAANLNQEFRRTILVRGAGTIVRLGSEPEPLMHGDLKSIVEGIEASSRLAQDGDLDMGLAALDAVQKGVMKARRLLRTQEDLEEKPSDDDVRALTQMQYFAALLAQPDPTPLQKAQSALTQAIVSVRKATDVEEAGLALDEVEKTLGALRAVLWEKRDRKKH